MTAIGVGGGHIAGIPASELAAEFGTPLYVYDLDAMDQRVAALRTALPPRLELAYAAKANPALAVLAAMAAHDIGLDIASGGELEAGVRAGFAPSRMVFTGPGKRDDELAAAVAAGLRAVTVESAGELERLERLAAAAERVVPVLLRVAVPDGDEPVPILGAGWRKFGIDRGELPSVAARAQASPWLDLFGLHAFGASNVTDAQTLAAHIAGTVQLAADLARRIGFRLRLVDAGGGLGIPYRDGDPELDLAELGHQLASMTAGWRADPALAEASVLLEPGRYLVGPCGVLLTRVTDRKRVGGRTVTILESGMHHALRPALVGVPHRLQVLANGPRRAPAEPVLVAGPLCTGLDVIGAELAVEPEPGDLFVVRDLGAYGFAEAMPLFQSHPTPAEVAMRGGRAKRIRRRLEPAEVLATQSIPTWT